MQPSCKVRESPNPWFCGKLIRSRVNPNRASSPGFNGFTRAKERPKSPLREWLETDEASAFPKPSPHVSVWQSGNGRRLVEVRVRPLPWSV
jgi:hypothetical protein